jgi:hypothetical protein
LVQLIVDLLDGELVHLDGLEEAVLLFLPLICYCRKHGEIDLSRECLSTRGIRAITEFHLAAVS